VRISISAYSLHRNIRDGKISMLDFIRIASERYGASAVELNSPFFVDEPGYLDRVKVTLRDYGVQVKNIAVDMGNIADPDDSMREKWVQGNIAWLKVAKGIGSPSIRVNAGHSDDMEEGLKRSVKSFKRIVTSAKELGLYVLLENHGGFSSDPTSILRILAEVGTDSFGTCPDFGNFDPDMRYEALERIAPYARFVHAKTYEFDADGEETTLDIPRIVRILEKAGYDGYVSVEFEGKGDEYEGIDRTIKLLERCGLDL